MISHAADAIDAATLLSYTHAADIERLMISHHCAPPFHFIRAVIT